MEIFLETERILLAHIKAADADRLYDLNSDPMVMTYLTDGRPNSHDEINALMQRCLQLRAHYQDRFGNFIAYIKSTKEFVGWFCLRPPKDDIDNFERIEFGYRLKRDFWGQGIATEVTRALIDKAFNEYQVPAVMAIAMAENSASIHVMKKVGCHFVRRFQEMAFPGIDKTAVLYEMANPHFKNKSNFGT